MRNEQRQRWIVGLWWVPSQCALQVHRNNDLSFYIYRHRIYSKRGARSVFIKSTWDCKESLSIYVARSHRFPTGDRANNLFIYDFPSYICFEFFFFFVGVFYDVKSLTHTTHTIHLTSTSIFFFRMLYRQNTRNEIAAISTHWYRRVMLIIADDAHNTLCHLSNAPALMMWIQHVCDTNVTTASKNQTTFGQN